MRTISKTLILCSLLTACAAAAQSAEQAEANVVAAVAADALAQRRDTQNQLDDWAAERVVLKQRWETARAQVAFLEERVALERDRLAGLESAGQELTRRLEESQRLETSLEDTLLGILGRLDVVVAQDLPFLAEERQLRLETVRRELSDPAATSADKLRRVLEALLIEVRYGGMLETYQDRITVAGESLTCDLLYVGRLGLFWLTPDGARGGLWDVAAACYGEVTGDELDAIRSAVQMATRQRVLGVQPLPLGRVGS